MSLDPDPLYVEPPYNPPDEPYDNSGMVLVYVLAALVLVGVGVLVVLRGR